MRTMKLGFQAYCGKFHVCHKWSLAKFWGFWPQIRPNMTVYSFWGYFLEKNSAGFTWNLIYKLIWINFWVCKRNILGHFGPPNESKFRFSNILLKRLLRIHISLALSAHWSYFQRCVQNGPQRPNFWAILGPKVSQICGVRSRSQKKFTGFTSALHHMLIASTFRCLENMGLRVLIVGPLWAPK